MRFLAYALVGAALGSGATFARPAAFPGAEGAGADSRGGRGGRVIEVTTLAESGPGSLRAALEAPGPRTVIFKVAGTIDLRRNPRIDVLNPFITIAGQSAPGGGITIRNGTINIATHDLIVRYLRLRPGRLTTPTSGIFIREGSENIMIDHCSLSWATDENITIYASTKPIRNVTVQWSIAAEGLTGTTANDHGAGAIVGSERRADLVENITFHHNLFASNQFRNPYVKGKSAQVINNIVYGWQWWGMMLRGGITADIIANDFIVGRNFQRDTWTTRRGVRYTSPGDNGNYGAAGNPSIYIAGNRDALLTNPFADNWPMIEGTSNDFVGRFVLSRNFQRSTGYVLPRPVTISAVADLSALLLPVVGAGARMTAGGSWAPARDRVDQNVVRTVQTDAGRLPASVAAAGGYPAIKAAAGYLDRDGDGQPDEWEAKYQFSATAAADGALDADGDGYANLEEYLNGTHPREVGRRNDALDRSS